MSSSWLERIDAAARILHPEPPHTRHTTWASVLSWTDPQIVSVFVFDVWDQPHAAFEVPALDLQPELLRSVYAAIRSEVGRTVARGAPPEQGLGAAFAAMSEGLKHLAAEPKVGLLYSGAGAMAAGWIATPDRAALGWVGTCRVSRVREGQLAPLTTDHALLLPPRNAEEDPHARARREIISNAIVAKEPAKPGFSSVEMRPGDLFLLTTRHASVALEEAPPAQDTAPGDAALELVTRGSARAPSLPLAAAAVRFR